VSIPAAIKSAETATKGFLKLQDLVLNPNGISDFDRNVSFGIYAVRKTCDTCFQIKLTNLVG
jgi:hypothetical protein